MSDLFGTPDGKREEWDEYRVVVTGPKLLASSNQPTLRREQAEFQGAQYADFVRWHIEQRTIVTYTTPWEQQ